MNEEIDKARREFLNDCEMVVKIPAILTVQQRDFNQIKREGNIPVNLYEYIGLCKLDSSEYEDLHDEEFYGSINTLGIKVIKASFKNSEDHTGLNQNKENHELYINDEGICLDSFEYIYSFCNESPDFKNFVNESLLKELKKSVDDLSNNYKIKIWSEIPPHPIISEYYSERVAIAIFSYIRNNKLEPKDFNQVRDNYINCILGLKGSIGYNGCPNEEFYSPSRWEKEVHANSEKVRQWISFRIIVVWSFLLNQFSEEHISIFSLLFGAKSIVSNDIPVYSVRGWNKIPKFCGDIDDESCKEEYTRAIIPFLEEQFWNEEFLLIREFGWFAGLELMVVYWIGHGHKLLGSLLEHWFPDNSHECQFIAEDGCDKQVHFVGKSLLLMASSSLIKRAQEEIKDSHLGWIHYSTMESGWDAEGARLLEPDEYKIMKIMETGKNISSVQLISEDYDELNISSKKYFVFEPNKDNYSTKKNFVSEAELEKKYLSRRGKVDIFILSESIFVKKDKEIVELKFESRHRKMLIIFLLSKDTEIKPKQLYKKAWADSLNRSEIEHLTEKAATNIMKTAKSQLCAEINKHIPYFDVEKKRDGNYICKGNFSYCVILKKEDYKKYSIQDVKYK